MEPVAAVFRCEDLGHTETNSHSHSHLLSVSPMLHVLGLREEVPGENPCRHMQTAHLKDPVGNQTHDLQSSRLPSFLPSSLPSPPPLKQYFKASFDKTVRPSPCLIASGQLFRLDIKTCGSSMGKSYKFDDMKQLIQLNDKVTCMDRRCRLWLLECVQVRFWINFNRTKHQQL